MANEPNEPPTPIATQEERMAMIANVMALNQYMGPQPLFDIADAYTGATIQYQDDTVEWRFNTPTSENNEREDDMKKWKQLNQCPHWNLEMKKWRKKSEHNCLR